jgi:hypothetical protein
MEQNITWKTAVAQLVKELPALLFVGELPGSSLTINDLHNGLDHSVKFCNDWNVKC